MSGRRAVPETLRQFFNRRYRELAKLPEYAKIDAMELANIVEDEFYDCAFDPVPPIPERTLH
ncbi:MAG: hypothetical protein A3G20_05060 [Acidobacteria bacterium RIFCSPLOWO2_12_FULL_59_11]|nr:MAG: hypothetical protein A3G20_05060 [Acidobacteria bacterium RIFCSPLOWO2_12_FULL_59_11]